MKKLGQEAINAGKQIQRAGNTITAAGSTIAATVTVPITGIATAAVKTAADFESAMSQVAATMGKTQQDVKDMGLTDLAKQMGATTAFSAIEAADGINILAMAGLTAQEIGDGLGTVLNLAAAGAIDMGSAASYVIGAVKGFGDEVANASKYANLMAKGATLANTDVASLGEAISYSAATAAGYSQNVDSMTLSLLRMAEQNVTGQTAATSLNRAMADLYTPTAEAQKALEQLGISAYNADGSARDFNAVVDELSASFKGMSEAEANALKNTIFTTNGLNAFNKMTASASERVEELRAGLEDTGDSAALQAATQLDNLNGQLTLLKSATEGILITIGDKLMPFVKDAVSWIQKAADFINGLSDAQVENMLKWAGIAAAIGPGIMVFGKVVSTIGGVITKFGEITRTVGRFGGVLKMLTSPAGIVIMVLAGIALAAVLIIKNWDKVKEMLSKVGDWFKDAFDRAGVSVDGFKNTFKSIGDTVGEIVKTIGEFIKAIADIFRNEFGAEVSEGTEQVENGMKNAVAAVAWAMDAAAKAVDGGLKAFSALLDFFGGAFRGDWESAAQGFRDSVKEIFPENAANGIIAFFDGALPVVVAVVDGMKAAFKGWFQDVKQIFANVKDIFGGVGDFLKGVFSGDVDMALGGFKKAAGSAVDAVGNIFKTGLDVIKNFTINALSSFLPQETIDKISRAFDAVASGWDAAMSAAKGCVDGFVRAVRPLFDNIKTVLSGVSRFLKGVFAGDWKGALEGLKTMAKGSLSGLANIFKAPFKVLKGIVGGAIGKIKEFDIVKKITSSISGAFDSMGSAIKGALSKCGVDVDKLGNNIANIKNRIGSILSNIKILVMKAFTPFVTIIKNIFSNLKSVCGPILKLFGGAVAATCKTVGEGFSNLKEIVKWALSSIGGVVSGVVDSVVNIFSGLITALDGALSFLSNLFSGEWEKAWEGVKDIFKGVFDSFAALCKTPINAVIGIINGAINGINKLGLTIPEWVPVIGGESFSLEIPTIPMLYKGTDNWMGGAAIIHDRGGEIVDLPKGTRVYPHDRSIQMARKEGAAQSGSIVINIQKLAEKVEVRSDGDIDRIAEALANKLKKIAFNTGMV